MASLPSSHPGKAPRSALSVLYLTTDEPPHDVHLRLCLPALANPFFLSLAPQTAQTLRFVADPSEQTVQTPYLWGLTRPYVNDRTHILSYSLNFLGF